MRLDEIRACLAATESRARIVAAGVRLYQGGLDGLQFVALMDDLMRALDKHAEERARNLAQILFLEAAK